MLRVAVLASPAVASLVTVWVLGRLIPAPSVESVGLVVLRVGALLVAALAAARTVDRVVRRLMPLVMLLQMSMLFPGRAPSRFRLARRACSTDVGRR